MMQAAVGLDESTRELEALLAAEGLHAALHWLNARTRFRYTGLYRFEPPLLRNLALFDRENPEVQLAGSTPLRETWCSVVGERRAPVDIVDAAAEPGLASHPAGAAVIAYSGAPVMVGGACVGSLCHFDARPRLLPPGEQALLVRAATLVAGVVGA